MFIYALSTPMYKGSSKFNFFIWFPHLNVLSHQLNDIKSVGQGMKILTVLFLCATAGKFCVVFQDDKNNKFKFRDTLTINNTYFVKNTMVRRVEGIENLYEATSNMMITISKKPLQTTNKYNF